MVLFIRIVKGLKNTLFDIMKQCVSVKAMQNE